MSLLLRWNTFFVLRHSSLNKRSFLDATTDASCVDFLLLPDELRTRAMFRMERLKTRSASLLTTLEMTLIEHIEDDSNN
ncbi:hypothetical protein F2P81_004054 [Scophthalmus maximus]|uniref:Uncharacterized protein n=1 Tax=Scophthalmus maximus TaxID=52904 RepID=A0A6A4T8P5_SCOMX|nr:hypothetical protein F2P81_004054 [Scophthalmus maximus]